MHTANLDMNVKITQEGTLPDVEASVKETINCELFTSAKVTVPDGVTDQSFNLSATAKEEMHLLFITSSVYHDTALSYKIGVTSYQLNTPHYIRGKGIGANFPGDISELKFTNSTGQSADITIYLLADSGVGGSGSLAWGNMPLITGTFTVGPVNPLNDYVSLNAAFSDFRGKWLDDVTLLVEENYAREDDINTSKIIGGRLKIKGDTRSLAGLSLPHGWRSTEGGTPMTWSNSFHPFGNELTLNNLNSQFYSEVVPLDFNDMGWGVGDRVFIVYRGDGSASSINYEYRNIVSTGVRTITVDGAQLPPFKTGDTVILLPNRSWYTNGYATYSGEGGGPPDPDPPPDNQIINYHVWHSNSNLILSVIGMTFEEEDLGLEEPHVISVLGGTLYLDKVVVIEDDAFSIDIAAGNLIMNTYDSNNPDAGRCSFVYKDGVAIRSGPNLYDISTNWNRTNATDFDIKIMGSKISFIGCEGGMNLEATYVRMDQLLFAKSQNWSFLLVDSLMDCYDMHVLEGGDVRVSFFEHSKAYISPIKIYSEADTWYGGGAGIQLYENSFLYAANFQSYIEGCYDAFVAEWNSTLRIRYMDIGGTDGCTNGIIVTHASQADIKSVDFNCSGDDWNVTVVDQLDIPTGSYVFRDAV